MALPGGVTPITITGKVTDSRGVPATGGTISFRMPYPLSDGPDHVVLAPGTWSFAIGADGTIDTSSTPMPAASSAGVTPTGWSYEITVRAMLADSETWYRKFFATIPANTSFEQLLAAASPTPAPASSFLPISAVGATVAPLVGGKVPIGYLPAGGGGAGVDSVAPLDGTIEVDNSDPTNPKIGVLALPQSKVTNLVSALGQLTDDVTAASNAAAGAATAAGGALSAANSAGTAAAAAQTTASAAYVKPGSGIPAADFAASVQASLGKADTAVQSVPIPTDPAAARFGGFACNVPLYTCNALSTINNEAWGALVPVRAGQPIGGAFAFRTDATGVNSSTGNNGFAVYDVPAAGGAGALLGNSVSDDLMWTATGKIDKAIPGVPTPSADGLRLVVVSVRGYGGDPPEFLFTNMDNASGQFLAQLFGKYKGGGFAAWPATLDFAVDFASGAGFILPVFLRS